MKRMCVSVFGVRLLLAAVIALIADGRQLTPQFRQMEALEAFGDDWAPAVQRWDATVHFNQPPTGLHRFYDFVRPGRWGSQSNSPKKDRQHGGYINQFLDHFSATDQRQFKQYFYHSTADEGRVNFLFICGEGALADFNKDLGLGAYRREFRASVYHLEHRFYGDSQPFKAPMRPNFAYLTVEQALADAAVFIRAMNELKQRDRPGSKPPIWIVFSGSYPGALAAWLRLKFPRLVHGAVASSAAVEIVTDFPTFYDVVDRRMRKVGGAECAHNIRSVFQDFTRRLNTLQGTLQLGIARGNGDAELSRNIKHFVDAQVYEVTAVSTSSYNEKTRQLCARAQAYLRKVALDRNSTSDLSGALVRDSAMTYRHSSSILPEDLTWIWQCCTQLFSFPRLRDHRPADYIFGDITLRDLKMECDELFDHSSMYGSATPDEIVAAMQRIYGGKQYRGTDVLFISGEEDVWYDLCINEQPPGVDRFRVILTGAGHCQDMWGPCDDADEDSPRLKAAHRELVRWLRELVGKNGGNE